MEFKLTAEHALLSMFTPAADAERTHAAGKSQNSGFFWREAGHEKRPSEGRKKGEV